MSGDANPSVSTASSPSSSAASPPEPNFIDMTGKLYNAVVPYDDSFYDSLARVLNEEPVQQRDLEMMGMLLPLGIEKGKEFKPDAATRAQLKSAAAEAQAWLIEGITSTCLRYWPDSEWNIPTPPIGIKTEFLWEDPNYFDVDARGTTLASFFGPVAKLGAGSLYLNTFFDKDGGRLTGVNTYRLHVPASVPASDFWAVTVYEQETAAFFRNSAHLTVDSRGCARTPMAPWMFMLAQRRQPAWSPTGSTRNRGRTGIRGFGSTARRRRSSIKRGSCRTLRRSADASG
jgi:hypothetical protein